MAGITIVGTGRFVPGTPVTNNQLARVMDTSDDWIQQRSGIQQRYYADENQGASDLALEASLQALDNAKLRPQDIDYIILGTMTPEYIYPGSGALLGAKLGIPGVPALDIRQQCAAMPFAMQLADGLLSANAAKTILVVGTEVQSGFMPWKDWDVIYEQSDRKVDPKQWDKATRHRGIAVLFGDGAGAFVMKKADKPGHGLLASALYTDGRDAQHIFVESGFKGRSFVTEDTFASEKYIPQMKGRDLFKSAVLSLPKAVKEVCDKANVRLEDVDWFLAHQANDRINKAVRDSLHIPPEKIPSNIARYGNTSAATIPILMDEMVRDGRIQPGQLICFLALGAGLHWGASLMRL